MRLLLIIAAFLLIAEPSAFAIRPVMPSIAKTEAKAAQAKPEEKEAIACVTDQTGFFQDKTFKVTLTNDCEARIRCVVSVYLVTARGPKTGQGVVQLAPKSKGDDAVKSYVMDLETTGGMANVSRQCHERGAQNP